MSAKATVLPSDTCLTCKDSYFYSAEWWAGILSADRVTAQRRLLILTVFIGGILALLAGPAAAVLMIPTRQDLNVGGAIFWMNGMNCSHH